MRSASYPAAGRPAAHELSARRVPRRHAQTGAVDAAQPIPATVVGMTSTDWLVLSEGGRPTRVVPIIGSLLAGRTCAGASASPHLLLDDPAISRDHFELRVDELDGVVLVDRSTNGTRVNGRRVQRDEPLSLTDGDFVEVGTIRLSFRSLDAPDRISDDVRALVRAIDHAHVATVVGDVVGYAAMAERDGEAAVAATADERFAALAELLAGHGATASHRDGDSLFAAWDVTADPQAAAQAVRFGLAAAELADDDATLPMGLGRDPRSACSRASVSGA